VAELSDRRDQQAQAALEEMRKAVGLLLEADNKENEALNLLENRGSSAVQQVERAIQARVRDARSENVDGTDERLTLMTREGQILPYVALLEGDMKFVAASIHAQRSEDLRRHANILESVEDMDIDTRRALVPADLQAERVPDSVWQADAAEAAAAEAYDKTIVAGEEAIDVYKEKSSELNDLWVVRANIAAVSYMLAEFIEDPTIAREFRDQAYQEYERSIRDRPDSEAAKTYKPIMDKLTQAQ
jgi:hypothetical protein